MGVHTRKKKTTLASGIELTEYRAFYDASCKRILSEKIVLAWLMKSCLAEYRDCDAYIIAEKYIEGQPFVGKVPVAPDETGAFIRGRSQAQTSLSEGSVSYDIYFDAAVPSAKEIVQLIINVEAQADFNPGYPLIKRGIYYCGRMISAQYGTVFSQAHYEKLRKVYSIWVCTNAPKKRQNSISSYQMYERCAAGDSHEAAANYDLLSVLMVCLGDINDEKCQGILRLLSVLLTSDLAAGEKKRILQNEFNIAMTRELESEVDSMGGFIDSLAERCAEKGRREGRREGLSEGKLSGILEAIRSLMASMSWEADKAMDALRIPDSERQYYLQELAKLRG